MAAASRTALAVALTASLAPEAATSELRTVSAANGSSKGPHGAIRGLSAVSSRPCTAIAQLRPRTISCSANVNDVAVSTAPVAEVPASSPESSNGAQIQETSTFISDVANLIKLVDSRDIVELELKHKKYEIVIRKKEALKQEGFHQSMPGPHVMAHTSFPQYAPQPLQAAPASAPPPPVQEAAPAAAPAAAPPAPVAPSHPPMRSPMAGTFYRSPAPGEPPFVKVGDRVQKGQVICIVEAMKLMNEIEADRSGTIVDLLLPDASPVAIDTALFAIEP